MNNLYINEEWYLCYDDIIYDETIDKKWYCLLWKKIWLKQIKFKVNKDWKFEEIKD